MSPERDSRPYLSEFNGTWYQDADALRDAMASTVVCFETSDPMRVDEFLRHKRDKERRLGRDLFVYDRWRGLRIEAATGGTRREEDLPLDLADALRTVDERLQSLKPGEEACDLVITDLIELRKGGDEAQDWRLVDALRAWAREDPAYSSGFTAYIFTPTATVFDEQTRRQFIVVPVPVSEDSERHQVLEFNAKQLKVDLEGQLDSLAKLTSGLDIHQLRAALLGSFKKHHRFDPAYLQKEKSRLIRTSGLLELEEARHGFEKVGGYQKIKDFIRDNVVRPLTAEGAARAGELGLELPRGILLFGPQGTGKSLLARALAKEVGLPFINFRTENIYSQYLGVSGQQFAQATKLIDALSPAIVFIDEIDRFGRRTAQAGDSAGEETRRVFSQMLEWLGEEQRTSLMIGTTNRPGDLDPAFLRAGRFDYKIPMGFPDEEARFQILWLHLGCDPEAGIFRVPVEMDDDELEHFLRREIVPGTELFKGSELEQLVIRSKREAARRDRGGITKGDILNVLDQFEINRKGLEKNKADFDGDVEEFADDKSLV